TRGEVQLAGYLDAGVAERDQAQDLDLTCGQLVLGERLVQRVQPGSHPWAYVLLATCRCANTGLSSIVSTTIWVSGTRSRNWLRASMPDPSGMLRSSTSTCGW